MIVFPCQTCQTPLSADDAQAGSLVRCPTCSTTLKVPHAAIAVAAPVPQAPVGYTRPPVQSPLPRMPMRQGGKRYGFNCGYCSSRLEATEAMAAQEGQCPTCGNTIVIPILDRYNRLIDPRTQQIIKQDPHPVHAYAAAGERAPKIIRRDKDEQFIECPRCRTISPISSNNCKSCGMPFTMEGTTLEAAGTSNGFCVASLVLGIVGIPAGCLIVPPILAVVFGSVGFVQSKKNGATGAGMAISGIVCGAIGCIWGVMYDFYR
jgi:DNA-directed RNA polymerase subunit RPC12/RpoP